MPYDGVEARVLNNHGACADRFYLKNAISLAMSKHINDLVDFAVNLRKSPQGIAFGMLGSITFMACLMAIARVGLFSTCNNLNEKK